jgi:mRNA interferase RelE/StbE
LLSNFQIAEALTFQKKIESATYKRYYSKIKENIYPRLRDSPFFGPNIKRLKGEFKSIYRYRIGSYRVFYTIGSEKKIVFILDFTHRKDAYR